MADSHIEWTNKTWNPLAGCSMVSAGCANCYAIRMAFRLQNMGQSDYNGLTQLQTNGKRNWTGEVRTLPKRLAEPLKWKKPVRVFVNSMSDLFHEDVPFEFIDQVFAVMALCPQHTFQVLTKRPERMAKYFARQDTHYTVGNIAFISALRMGLKNAEDYRPFSQRPWPLPNVWLGTSVEDQKAADERIPHLLQVPAAVRFLSCEPLLGKVDLSHFHIGWWRCRDCGSARDPNPDVPLGDPSAFCRACNSDDLEIEGHHLHWVIAGGESGPGARPMHWNWAFSLRDQCRDANVPFFFKQWGEWVSGVKTPLEIGRGDIAPMYLHGKSHDWNDGSLALKVGKKSAGRLLDGVEYSEFPQAEAANA